MRSRPCSSSRTVSFVAVAVSLACSTPGFAGAAESGDSTYGRIDGDIGVVVGVGATVASRGMRAAADLRLRYLDSLGAFVTYEDGAMIRSGSDPRRLIVTGLEVRPLFLARWLRGHELGSAFGDLVLDSLGVEVGALFPQPVGGPFASRPGLQLGLGVEVPLFLRASGPWVAVHGGVRWSDGATSLGAVEGPADRALFVSMTLAWHQIFGAHVVDMSDRAVR